MYPVKLFTGAIQHWVDNWVILAVALAIAIIGFHHEDKAGGAMPAIRGMLVPQGAVDGTGSVSW